MTMSEDYADGREPAAELQTLEPGWAERWLDCVLCLYTDEDVSPAVTICDGMAVCERHLGWVSTTPAMLAKRNLHRS